MPEDLSDIVNNSGADAPGQARPSQGCLIPYIRCHAADAHADKRPIEKSFLGYSARTVADITAYLAMIATPWVVAVNTVVPLEKFLEKAGYDDLSGHVLAIGAVGYAVGEAFAFFAGFYVAQEADNRAVNFLRGFENRRKNGNVTIADEVIRSYGMLKSKTIQRSVRSRLGNDKYTMDTDHGSLVFTHKGVALVDNDTIVAYGPSELGKSSEYASIATCKSSKAGTCIDVLFRTTSEYNPHPDLADVDVGCMKIDPSNGSIDVKILGTWSYHNDFPRLVKEEKNGKEVLTMLKQQQGTGYDWKLYEFDSMSRKLVGGEVRTLKST